MRTSQAKRISQDSALSRTLIVERPKKSLPNHKNLKLPLETVKMGNSPKKKKRRMKKRRMKNRRKKKKKMKK